MIPVTPCYIIGFSGATADDYIVATELMYNLKSEGFIGWISLYCSIMGEAQ